MMLRLFTAAILIPIVVIVVLWTPSVVIAALAALVLLLALDEFFRLAERMAMRGYRFWTMLSALALIYAQWAENTVETRHLGGNVELVRNLGGVTISIEAVLLIFVLGATLIGIFSRQAIAEVLPAICSSSAALNAAWKSTCGVKCSVPGLGSPDSSAPPEEVHALKPPSRTATASAPSQRSIHQSRAAMEPLASS